MHSIRCGLAANVPWTCVSLCVCVSVDLTVNPTKTLHPIDAPFGAWLGPRKKRGKGSSYSITERRVPELIPLLDSQPAADVSHKPGGRLPLLSARPAVTSATLKRAATNFAAW